MKQTFLLALFISLLAMLSCKKDKKEELPPETQTGAGTFGCLVDREVYTPGGVSAFGGSELGVYYQLVNGRYHFVINARNDEGNANRAVGVFTDSLQISEGKKYEFSSRKNGNVSAGYIYSGNNVFKTFLTDGDQYTGELWIKKLDTIQQIVSGTFWYDAVSSKGEKAEIREGRFDLRYRK